METNSNIDTRTNRFDNRGGRIGTGLILVVVGSLFLAHQAGADIPHWLFSWEMILIGIGLFAGAKHNFRPGGWMVMLIVGAVFLADDLIYDFNFRPFAWPVIIIAIGLFIMLKPRGRRWKDRHSESSFASSDDTLESNVIFSGEKKKIITKDFKGGQITTMFGGTDLDFTQADIAKSAEIDVSITFGGLKLVVPANWNIKSEVVCIFGGIDEKRSSGSLAGGDKTLVLKGNVICGGIEIKSY